MGDTGVIGEERAAAFARLGQLRREVERLENALQIDRPGELPQLEVDPKTAGLAELVDEYHVDYILDRHYPPLRYPIAYMNATYVVYRIDDRNSK